MKKHFIKFVVALATLGLNACAVSENKSSEDSVSAKLETLHAINISNSSISVKVISTGCTKSADFEVETQIMDNICELRINRIHPDLCKRAPSVEQINLPWNRSTTCQGYNIQVMNNILPDKSGKLPERQGHPAEK